MIIKADVVLHNGIIYPVVPEKVTFEAIAIKSNKIISIGSFDEIREQIDTETMVYDLKGQMLLPGFIDTHTHLLDTGLMETWLNLSEIQSVEQLLKSLSEQATKLPEGHWIVAGNFDENEISQKRFPTLDELDSYALHHPVYINHKSYHCSMVNSRALRCLDLKNELKGLGYDFSGRAVKGLLTQEANRMAKEKLYNLITKTELDHAFHAVSRKAASVGLTTIHCVEGGEYWGDSYPDYILKAADTTFEPVLYFNTDCVDKVIERKLSRMGGDIFMDGSISNHSAALMEGYSDDVQVKGCLFRSKEDVCQLIKKAHEYDIQISFHAIGDRAIEEILSAYEAVLSRLPVKDHRHRIEHFGIPSQDHIIRAKKLGLAIATQPAFLYQKEKTYLSRLGEERFSRAYPLRELVDAGLFLGGGSDSMVSPLDPMYGIHCAVNYPNRKQRISVEEAINLYTIWAAALAFQEKEKGSLEPGKLADMVVLNKNILKVKPSQIKDIKISGTMYRGKVIYGFKW